MISMNGAEAGGAFLYFIAITPYVVLLIFLGIGLSTAGGPEGIAELFQADWEALKDARVWIDASSQIFFSLSVCFGGIVAFSSYNPIKQNLLRDATIVASVNSGTSLFASCVIFSLLGNRAWTAFENCKSTTIDNSLNFFDEAEDFYGDKTYDEIYDFVLNKCESENCDPVDVFQRQSKCDFSKILQEDTPSGTGLIFIAVAEAVVDLPGSFILSMIFFFMVILLGLGSMVGTFEGVITPVYDGLQASSKWRKIPKQALVLVMSCFAFAIGLIFATNAGNYWLDIFNDYSASINLLIIGVLQFVVVAWIYGAEKWLSEIDWMIYGEDGEQPGLVVRICRLFLKTCWTVLSPGLILFVLIFFMVDIFQNPPAYKVWDKTTGDWKLENATNPDSDYLKQEYSAAGSAVIAILHILCLIWIPVMLIKALFKDGKFSFKNWRTEEAIIYRGEQKIAKRMFRNS
ncbi:Oidioi.mRNA.OKI2018_I69.chr1.g1191.t1.cds [Oikopleura dioica]|uniref:Oidioi.mRNA.OKI2018_I69.chr1.g1191.t1.cds n=1 Tax=Oikopleura dioica TaxID=34765 RepID=A0ABN7SMP8_OIKDI|nr:Oidioi.mRNA.OKI2018_I69.chr1.g1191.t1.cds [Oikopleura dioica]